MCDVSVKIPEEVMFDTKMNSDETMDFIRKMAAIGYYTKMKVSTSYCARIAGMNESDFIEFLGQNGIGIFRFDSDDELLRDVKNA